MALKDDQIINVSVSGRPQTLELEWHYVRKRYLTGVFPGMEEVAEIELEKYGSWNGKAIDGIVLYLRMKK